MSLPLCLSLKMFPIASMNAIKTCVGQKRGVGIQNLLHPHSSSSQKVTELVPQNEEINLEEPRIAATAKIGIEFMRRINPQSSSYVRRARPPWEDSEHGGVFQDSVQCEEGGGPVLASPSMVVCKTRKNIRCEAHLGYRIMTGHQMSVIAPTALGRPNKLFLHILRVGE